MGQRTELWRGSDEGQKVVVEDRPLNFGKGAESDENSYLTLCAVYCGLTLYELLVALRTPQGLQHSGRDAR